MLVEFHVLIYFYTGFACSCGFACFIWRCMPIFILSSGVKHSEQMHYYRLAILSSCLLSIYSIILFVFPVTTADGYSTNIFSWAVNEFILQPSTQRLRFELIGMFLLAIGLVYGVLFSSSSSRNNQSFMREYRLTVRRKVFHFLAAGVFCAGLVHDARGLVFASGCLQLLFFLLEFCIYAEIEPIATQCMQMFTKFLKSAERGRRLGLSHTSLLIALALPVWLEAFFYPDSFQRRLPAYAGVVSIGVGDSVASFVGSWCAERFSSNSGEEKSMSWFEQYFEWQHWLRPLSSVFTVLVGCRTIIGSLGMFISQIVTWWVIWFWLLGADRWTNATFPMRQVLLSSVAGTFGELFGGDLDNFAASCAAYLSFYLL